MHKKPTKTAPRSWILNIILQLKIRIKIGEVVGSKTRQGDHKMNPEHLVFPESKYVVKRKIHTTLMGSC